MCHNTVKPALTCDFLGKNRDPDTIDPRQPFAGCYRFVLARSAQRGITGERIVPLGAGIMTALQTAFAAIDAANAADPTREDGLPAALLYGQRMTVELERLFPRASEALKIAARGQHIERWRLSRKDYPDGKEGYLAWRREQARRHAARVAGIMLDAGYDAEAVAAAEKMLRKEGIKRDPDVQALEDVICFVFLRWYFASFAAARDHAEVLDIVQKAARKMSAVGRARALAEFTLPDDLAAAFRDAP